VHGSSQAILGRLYDETFIQNMDVHFLECVCRVHTIVDINNFRVYIIVGIYNCSVDITVGIYNCGYI
jgi:hypothetical protein